MGRNGEVVDLSPNTREKASDQDVMPRCNSLAGVEKKGVNGRGPAATLVKQGRPRTHLTAFSIGANATPWIAPAAAPATALSNVG